MGASGKRRGCFQFSLRSFLVVMTVVAIGCGLLFGAPMERWQTKSEEPGPVVSAPESPFDDDISSE